MHRGKEKSPKALRLVSALLLVIALLGLVNALVLLFNVDAIIQDPESVRQLFDGQALDNETVILFVAVIAGIGIAESLLQIFSAAMGFRAAHGKAPAETCQVLGLGLIGAALISSLATGLLSGFTYQHIVSSAASVILPVLYYAAARRATAETFWQGIKEEQDHEDEKAEADSAASHAFEAPCSYRLEGRLVPVADSDQADVFIVGRDPALCGEACSSDDFAENLVRHCHADVLPSNVSGTLLLPVDMLPEEVKKHAARPLEAAYVLDEGHLVFATEDPLFPVLFKLYVDRQTFEKTSSAAVLFEFLRYLIGNDATYLNEVLERLDKLEENTSEEVNEIPKDFEEFVMSLRRSLRELLRFYKQYSHMGRTLATARSSALTEDDRALFTILADQSQRLADDTRDLLDYALQIKNLYQAKIDVRQNKVMQILTVVTSIFMPLTLITGWYGMNFKVMPELGWSMSYFVLIAVAIVIVTVEIIIFKRNKWF